MDWQEIVAFAVVGVTAALFVKGFLRRSPSSCGRGCACPAAGRKLEANRQETLAPASATPEFGDT